jgi:hypothetical protein
MKTSRKVIMVIVLAVVIALIVMAADFLCKLAAYTPLFLSSGPSEWRIESYGREKFVKQALEFGTTNAVNPDLSRHFGVKRVEPCDHGVLLVFGENKRYETGLYVDLQEQFEGTYGSGVSITPRSSHIGVAQIKKRAYVGVDLKGLATAHEIYANDYVDGMFQTEPNMP